MKPQIFNRKVRFLVVTLSLLACLVTAFALTPGQAKKERDTGLVMEGKSKAKLKPGFRLEKRGEDEGRVVRSATADTTQGSGDAAIVKCVCTKREGLRRGRCGLQSSGTSAFCTTLERCTECEMRVTFQ